MQMGCTFSGPVPHKMESLADAWHCAMGWMPMKLLKKLNIGECNDAF